MFYKLKHWFFKQNKKDNSMLAVEAHAKLETGTKRIPIVPVSF